MRISDWSSDVCSSDLLGGQEGGEPARALGEVAIADVDTGQVGLHNGESDAVSGVVVAEQGAEVDVGGVEGGEQFGHADFGAGVGGRSEEHTSELQSLMRISYAVFCLKTKK